MVYDTKEYTDKLSVDSDDTPSGTFSFKYYEQISKSDNIYEAAEYLKSIEDIGERGWIEYYRVYVTEHMRISMNIVDKEEPTWSIQFLDDNNKWYIVHFDPKPFLTLPGHLQEAHILYLLKKNNFIIIEKNIETITTTRKGLKVFFDYDIYKPGKFTVRTDPTIEEIYSPVSLTMKKCIKMINEYFKERGA